MRTNRARRLRLRRIRYITGIAIIVILIALLIMYIGMRNSIATDGEIETNIEAKIEARIPIIGVQACIDLLLENKEGNIEDLDELTEEELENLRVDKEKESNSANKTPYYIKINYGANVVTIYKLDENNEYTIPIKAMICSTGIATPKAGVYKMQGKYRWLTLFGNVYGQYCSRIVGHILFHSVPYLEKGNNGSIEYWEYDKLGQSASAGCIRLKVEDALWIYNNCSAGTMVEFYSDSNSGPLGKPTAQKISNAPENIRGWDPTDPDANNPWRTYNNNEEQVEAPSNETVPEIVKPVETPNQEDKDKEKDETKEEDKKEEDKKEEDKDKDKDKDNNNETTGENELDNGL